jgi:hypothetical protein
MSRRSAAVAALCGAGLGLGLWSTAASLDHAAGADGPFRVAMLPALPTLGLLMGVAGLAIAAVVALSARLGGPAASDRALDISKPLAAAGLLVLPYLPWLPEQVPAVLLLSGPGAWIWWGVLATGVVCTLAARRAPAHHTQGDPAAAATRRRWTTGILLLSLAASGLLADRFMRSPLFPGGDEPHYLIIAQSLWRDGDLKIENNHARRDYDEYFHRDLSPHYLTRGVDGEIYSIHPVGMPVLIAPVYAAGGYDATVWAFVLMGAAALTMAWRLAWAVTGAAGAATFGWAVLAFGVPWVFNTFSIYPEIPAALAVTTAFTLTAGWQAGAGHGRHRPAPPVRFLVAGLALATLPWLSTKYAVMALALGLVLLGRAWWPWPTGAGPRRRALLSTAAVAVPCVVSLGGWFSFFKIIWGTFSPAAPYGIQRETRLEYLPQGAPGLLFDQEYGVLLFAPALVLAIPGLFALWRQGGASRRLGLEIVAVWAGLLCIVGAFHIWWGGSAIVGRPVVSALPLLVVPVAAQWSAGAAQAWRRGAHVVLLATGLGLTVLLAVAQNGLLLVAGRDGSSQVLEYIAPSASLWTLWPTFLRQPPATAAAMTITWLAPILFTGWILGRLPSRAGTSGHALLGSSLALVASLAITSALVQAAFEPSTPPADVARRPRARLLDEFDDLRRPLALRYAPLGRLDPATVPGLFPLVVNDAGQRVSDPASRLFGQRLSLPAGRYGVDLVFANAAAGPVDGTLDVRVGRTGPPFQRWPVAVTPPGSWGRAFSLPVDAGFVGFEASPGIAGEGPQLRLTPQQVVPVSRRPAVPAVLGSGRYGDILLFVHGDDAWPEPEGLWVRGRSTAAITIVSATPRPLTVAVRAGARPVEVEVRIGSTTRHVALTPGQTTPLIFPAVFDAQLMQVTTSDGFVPADVEPGSRDHRLLGCWIEVR